MNRPKIKNIQFPNRLFDTTLIQRRLLINTMRLYVNTNEVPFLKDALRNGIAKSETPIQHDRLSDLLERVVLCEELQKSERRAKNEEAINQFEEV